VIYTVFSTSDSPSMQWQSELLEYSWKHVGQPGELIRLVGTDTGALPGHRHARTIGAPSWQVHPLTQDDYAPYNKPASLLQWLRNERPDGTVLLLDPSALHPRPVAAVAVPDQPGSIGECQGGVHPPDPPIAEQDLGVRRASTHDGGAGVE